MRIKKILSAVLTAGVMLSFIPSTSLADSNGWIQDGNDWKYYTTEDGFVKENWKQVDGIWYYFNADGIMLSGIENYRIHGKYYSFSANGACKNPLGMRAPKNGWFRECVEQVVNSDSSKYFYRDKLIREYRYYWHYFENGKDNSGWRTINGKTYYFQEGGWMLTGSQYNVIADGDYYWFTDNGYLITGWIKDSDAWYYAGSDGKLIKDQWLELDGKWYYFTSNYRLVTNVSKFVINGRVYSFDHNGVCQNPDAARTNEAYHGWYMEVDEYNRYNWRYYDEDGKKCDYWKKIGNSWYYFDTDGSMFSDCFTHINGADYYFKPSGEMLTGWYHFTGEGISDFWCYATPTGDLCYNEWCQINGKWYYFVDEKMLADVENVTINGVEYSFDKDGACLNPYAKAQKITGWYKRYTGNIGNEYAWYYYDSNGAEYKDKWLNWYGTWYYFGSDGQMVCSDTSRITDKYYDFDYKGVCLNPFNGRDTK